MQARYSNLEDGPWEPKLDKLFELFSRLGGGISTLYFDENFCDWWVTKFIKDYPYSKMDF